MKNAIFLALFSLLLNTAASAQNEPAQPVQDPDGEITVTITRLSPLEPALYAMHATPASIDPKKRLEIIGRNLTIAEKNVAKSAQFLADVEDYLEFAREKAEEAEYKEEIPVAEAKLKKWRKIRTQQLDVYERLQKDYAAALKKIATAKIKKGGAAVAKGASSVKKAFKNAKIELGDARDAVAAIKAAGAKAVDREDFCKGYGPFQGCVRMGDCPNSCSARKGCWIDNSKRCSMNPPIARTACWCKK
jgi:hypothetical protein